MTKKCLGCGALLQTTDEKEAGYVKDIHYEKALICERCFRIKNYNEYKTVLKDNKNFINMLNAINKTKDLVVLVIDVLNMPEDLNFVKELLSNDILLVLTKRDLLPKSISNEKLLSYVNNYKIKYVDKVLISSNKNYQFDLLLEKIVKYKHSNNVYVVGYTNAGKSTMINRFIHNYVKSPGMITTSIIPSTTIDNISVKISDELTLIDTPGILKDGSIINYVNYDMMKKILLGKEIKPKIYQVKTKQTISIENLVKVVCKEPNVLTFYVSSSLSFERTYEVINEDSKLKKHVLKVPNNSDIVIEDLGFIKVKNQAETVIFTFEGVNVYIRKALI